MKTAFRRFRVLFAGLSAAASLHAAVIDFENLAASGDVLSPTSGLSLGAYYMNQLGVVGGGIIVDSAHGWATGPNYAANGTDYFVNYSGDGFEIGRPPPGGFSLVSFDATDWTLQTPVIAYKFTVTGFYVGGGEITVSFDSDANAGFETFTLGAGWTNLQAVQFTDNAGGNGAYDNIVVNGVPDTGSIASFLLAGAVALFSVSGSLTWMPASKR